MNIFNASIMVKYVSVNWEDMENILKFKNLFSSNMTQYLRFKHTISILRNTKLMTTLSNYPQAIIKPT